MGVRRAQSATPTGMRARPGRSRPPPAVRHGGSRRRLAQESRNGRPQQDEAEHRPSEARDERQIHVSEVVCTPQEGARNQSRYRLERDETREEEPETQDRFCRWQCPGPAANVRPRRAAAHADRHRVFPHDPNPGRSSRPTTALRGDLADSRSPRDPSSAKWLGCALRPGGGICQWNAS